jgi:murein DD-endopeptidase MepM/ murein hydrolase activator NlpD
MAGRCRLVAGSLLLALAMMAQPAPRPLDRTTTGPPAVHQFVASPPPIVHLRIEDIPLPEVGPPPAPAGAVWEDAVRATSGRDERPRPKHTVAARESLWTKSRAAGMRVIQLTRINHLSLRVVFRSGQTIVVATPRAGAPGPRPKGPVARAKAVASAARPSTGASQSSAAPMISPSYGTLTSRFGWRIHPIFGTREFHTGLDIANRYGTPVRAALGGIVQFAGWMAGYGRLVVVDHGGGLQTSYSHLSATLVSLGERVLKGQILGQIGSTGWSTGPHLFFEVRRNGVPVDPVPLLRRSGAIAAGVVR